MRDVQIAPSYRSGSLPKMEDVERLRRLTAPHVESFDYFLDEGLAQGVKAIEPAELDIIDPGVLRNDRKSIDFSEVSTVKFWVENARVGKPIKSSPGGSSRQNLLPKECRERSMMYAGPLRANFCFQVIKRRNGAEFPQSVVRLPKDFGNIPIMVGSKACHLYKTTPKQLSKLREEVRTSKCMLKLIFSLQLLTKFALLLYR
jgi:DNA-directed RNA polymerase I subunit RPA2